MSSLIAPHVFFHRSGMEGMQLCPRAAYYEYDYLGRGMHKSPKAIWFDVGIAVHYGLADLICGVTPTEAIDNATRWFDDRSGQEEKALGLRYYEQRVLIEALIWAFYYHNLQPFLDTYEVLFVEREVVRTREYMGHRVINVARPDVIVRDRVSGEIGIVNWKTINDLTDERRQHHVKSYQCYREHYFSEHYLRNLKSIIEQELQDAASVAGKVTLDELKRRISELNRILSMNLPEDGRIDYTQYVYLVKGRRQREKSLQDLVSPEAGEELSAVDSYRNEVMSDPEIENAQWRQDSFLIYPWARQFPAEGEQSLQAKKRGKGDEVQYHPALSWRWRYQKPGLKSFSTLSAAGYKREIVGLSIDVREYVERLNANQVFPNTIMPELHNPLNEIIVYEAPVYRKEAMMESLNRQAITQENSRVQRLYSIAGMTGPELAQQVEVLFPQHLQACTMYTKCQFYGICHEAVEVDFVGLPEGFAWRESHHAAEAEYLRQVQAGEIQVERPETLVISDMPRVHVLMNDEPVYDVFSEVHEDGELLPSASTVISRPGVEEE